MSIVTVIGAGHKGLDEILTTPVLPSTAVRKGYHVLAVSLFLPALLLEPQLLGVALAAALTLLLAVEALRLSGLPLIGGWGASSAEECLLAAS